MSFENIMTLPPELRPLPNDTPDANAEREQSAKDLLIALGSLDFTKQALGRVITALHQAEIQGQVFAAQRFQLQNKTLIDISDFDLQQRVIPLAKALLEAGMDVETLLSRMMGLE